MISGTVFDIRKYSIHDGPGIRTAVFLKGCPLSCWWCHNPESQSAEPEMMVRESRCIRCGACVEVCAEEAIAWEDDRPVTRWEDCVGCGECAEVCYADARERVGRAMTVADVMAEVRRDIAFYDESGGGVTLSGGEPLAQRDFALGLLRACQEAGIRTALDTCGFATWSALDSIRPYVDLFLYDLKLIDDGRHLETTGASNALILANLRALSERGHHIRVRVPVIPGINDDDASISAIGAFAAALPGLDGLDLLPYHHLAADKYRRMNRPYRLAEARPLSPERMASLVELLQAFGLAVTAP